MGNVPIPLHQALSGFSRCLKSVDIRVAAYRGPIAQPPSENWIPFRTVIRVSFREVTDVLAAYAGLEAKLTHSATRHVRILHKTLPFSSLSSILPNHGLTARIIADDLAVEPTPLDPPGLIGRVSRYRDRGRSVRSEEWPTIEYSFRPATAPSAASLDMMRLHAEIRGETGMHSPEAFLKAYLEVHDSSGQPGGVFIQIETPAMITGIRSSGASLFFEITGAVSVRDVRLFVTKQSSDGIGIEEHAEASLAVHGQDGALSILRGEARFRELTPEDRIECVLTHAEVPEVDDAVRRVRDLLPKAELNPLLVCLGRFWKLDELFSGLEHPHRVPRRKPDLSPQRIFQTRIAHVLTLAGFQAFDLGQDEVIRAAESKVEIATADILAYHAGWRLLVVGACTIGVPKSEDYENVIHTAALLETELLTGTGVVIVPVLFSGQEPDHSIFADTGSRRLRVLGPQEITELRALIERGAEERLHAYLTMPSAQLK